MVSTVGLMFPACIGIGYIWGRLMDRYFGIYPWLTIIFTFLGIVAAFMNLYKLAMLIADEDREKKQ